MQRGKDSTGEDVKVTEKIYYREYTSKRTVQVTAGYQIVDVETGRYLSGDNLSERITDEAKWIRYQDSIYDLPRNKQKYLDARSRAQIFGFNDHRSCPQDREENWLEGDSILSLEMNRCNDS